ncbi:MAG: gamma-glutamyltransferase family protein [Chloroflexi bacterium]|nr:gamma-glutamyltransferase family protein [Chloroflexota bacterium]
MSHMTNLPEHPFRFESRRSPVLSRKGIVASSQPLASLAGLRILRLGGNAADAAVAAAAALAVVEPTSTGIGGDCFCLFYRTDDQSVSAMNGSGRAPAALDLDVVERCGGWDRQGPHAVTVPGSIMGWHDTVSRFGRMTLADVLQPAIEIAEEGFVMTPAIARGWAGQAELLAHTGPAGQDLLRDGAAPRAGEVWVNPLIARVMREVAEGGLDAFYRGRPAERIVEALEGHGGVMALSDLAGHCSTFDDAISTTYRRHRVWECPPNGQGITTLMALNILEGFEIDRLEARSPEALHLIIESLRLAFADARALVADPAKTDVPIDEMLSKAYAAKRRQLICEDQAIELASSGFLPGKSDTVYLSTADGEGNACSFINSNYEGFGSCIVPSQCGFSLQNRGAGFVVDDPDHPNALAGGKRPYHTIMPSMITRPDGGLFASYGVMGGWNQPQGQTQVVVNLLDRGMDAQTAIDAPRVSMYEEPPNGRIYVEDTFGVEVLARLSELGHSVVPASGAIRTGVVGKGQIIYRDPDSGVLWGGSDPRADGCAVPL